MRFAYLTLATLLIFCLYANHAWAVSNKLTVKILDVGQGDSILIQTPHGKTILVDGGPRSTLLDRMGEESSFWLRTIDMIVVTNPDRDHLEGFLEVMQRYEVKRLLYTGVIHRTKIYAEFLNRVEAKSIPTFLAAPDQDWQLDDEVFLDIIAPLEPIKGKELKKSNNGSIVMKLIYGDTTMLLTGDAEAIEEKSILMSDADIRANILKSGHHGSRTSSTLPFLEAIQPEYAVMSNGNKNSYNHPHLETVLSYDQLGIDWQSTKDVGTVTFESDGKYWERR
jgi:competence protein ComEC